MIPCVAPLPKLLRNSILSRPPAGLLQHTSTTLPLPPGLGGCDASHDGTFGLRRKTTTILRNGFRDGGNDHETRQRLQSKVPELLLATVMHGLGSLLSVLTLLPQFFDKNVVICSRLCLHVPRTDVNHTLICGCVYDAANQENITPRQVTSAAVTNSISVPPKSCYQLVYSVGLVSPVRCSDSTACPCAGTLHVQPHPCNLTML